MTVVYSCVRMNYCDDIEEVVEDAMEEIGTEATDSPHYVLLEIVAHLASKHDVDVIVFEELEDEILEAIKEKLEELKEESDEE